MHHVPADAIHPRLRPYADDRYLDEPWTPPDDRLTELVFVDGLLVSHTTGSVEGTDWAGVAARLERARRQPPPPPPLPLWQRVLDWLGDRVGGQEALAALGTAPLGDPPDLLEDYATPAQRQRVEAVADLLDAVAGRCFDAGPSAGPAGETATAMRTALLRLRELEPEAVTRAPTAAASAGGIAWAVARANGLLHPVGALRVGAIKDVLGLRSSPSSYGSPVRAGLLGFRHLTSPAYRPEGVPDLLDLGHPDLLTSATRTRLVHLRDRAWQARDAAA